MSNDHTVLFVGIGKMGWPMAERLAAAGYELIVADADEARARLFAEQHGGRAASLTDSEAIGAGVVITMLPTSDIVGSVLFGANGLSSRLAAGTLYIEMSSGVPGRTREFAERLGEVGCTLIDAPVSGGVARAETGQLAIMVGGDDASLARAEPLLRTMGTAITHAGQVGSAHAMKALNNLVSAAGLLIAGEALLVGKGFGLDPALMVDILNASTGMNNATKNKLKQFVLSGSYDSGFGLDLMIKDLTIALDVARATGTPVPFASLCREMAASCGALLGPGRDHTEFVKLSERLANREL